MPQNYIPKCRKFTCQNANIARVILRSYARNLSTLATKASIVANVSARAENLLGHNGIEEGAKHLLELKNLVRKFNEDDNKPVKLREPDLLIVLTGGEMAYTRLDGVKIIPIGCLKD